MAHLRVLLATTPRAGGAPERQAFVLLRTVFTLAPIVFGVDKLTHVLADWEGYLAPWIDDLVPGSARTAMLLVGVVEVVAGLAVALRPQIGAYLVAGWLLGIILDLVTQGKYYDIALRDFGLFVAALALARLAASSAARPVRAAEGTR